MASKRASIAESRIPLSRERVFQAAIKLADEGGVGSVTMRRLAEELGAEAMSLYYHVANKDEVLAGMADAVVQEINDVVAEIGLPAEGDGWKQAVRRRILSAREVLLRHRWAPAVLETRATASPAMLRYIDGLLGLMRAGGFSYDLAHQALHALGSRAFGFVQELFNPGEGATNQQQSLPPELAEQFPNLLGMLAEIAHDDPDSTLGWCDAQAEFEFGVDLLLDGLDRLRATA